MFTGIIEEVGTVTSFLVAESTARMEVKAIGIAGSLQLGDSIAVNGVCLTANQLSPRSFQAELSQETLARSNLGRLAKGSLVNLERPLLPTSRLGGHFVQGHVDGVGVVLAANPQGDFAVWKFSLPEPLRPYVVEKGSIAVDGISLTVARLLQDGFEVALIPHTLRNTNLRARHLGEAVNLECDVLAKYVESFLTRQADRSQTSRLTVDYLRSKGF
ncbi:MAG: riboflavin synthase [Acidobacteriota bacterium]